MPDQTITLTLTETQRETLARCVIVTTAVCGKAFGDLDLDDTDSQVIESFRENVGMDLVELMMLLTAAKRKAIDVPLNRPLA